MIATIKKNTIFADQLETYNRRDGIKKTTLLPRSTSRYLQCQ